MKRDESVYVRHMLDAIQRVEAYLSNVTEEVFRDETLIQDAVIRQLEIIGEAAKHVSMEVRPRSGIQRWEVG